MAWERGTRAALAAALLTLAPVVAVAQSGGDRSASSLASEAGPTGVTGAIKPAAKVDIEKLAEAARQTVRTFKDRLKSELQTAIKNDGVANAISLCQTTAPDISIELSDSSKFEVTRTSLKLRNPENAPGAWEREVLNEFQEKAAAGTDPGKLERFDEIVTPEGDRLFRYMSGIATGEMCLSCHGSDIKPDVKAELVRYYPDDKATGYKLGELRGAFSLVKLIGE